MSENDTLIVKNNITPKIEWPISGQKAIELYGEQYLNDFERSEIS
jgi:hypothetical protein